MLFFLSPVDTAWSVDMMDLYAEMDKFMTAKLNSSAYGHIDLHKLFSKIVLPGTSFSRGWGVAGCCTLLLHN